MTTLTQAQSTIIGEPEVVEDASTAETTRRLARPEGRRHRAAAAADAGRQHPEEGRPRRGDASSSRASPPASAPSRPPSRTTPPTSRRSSSTSTAGSPTASACPTSTTRSSPSRPATHRVDKKRHLVVFPMYTQNGSTDRLVEALHRRGHLARVHRQARGDVHEQAVRVAALRRLHARLRHQLGGAVPRDGGDARDPGVHLGRDLRRTARRPGSAASSARPRRDHEARTARRRSSDCSTTRSWPKRPS